MNLQLLSAPFPSESISWRAQTVTKTGDKALALAYIDARDVMDRLDMACDPENWQSAFTETQTGRVLCKLELWVNDRWIAKTDGAGNTAVEGEKGGISDALKRAAVQWGIGRYLYDLKDVWAPCESYDSGRKDKRGNVIWAFSKWKPEAKAVFKKALDDLCPQAQITDAQRIDLINHMEVLQFPVAELLRVSKIPDLRQLPADKFDRAKDWITEQAKKKEAA